MWRKIGVFFCRLGISIFLAGHLYQVKSWLYRWLFEREYRNVEVPVYARIDDLVAFIRTLKWVPDTWKQGWDAFSYPGKVHASGTKDVGDCDEFALYCATAIKRANEAGTITGYTNPRVLTITWMKKDGALGGHNVCLLDKVVSDGKCVAYMDYGYPEGYITMQGLLDGVLNRYAGEGATCLGWGVTDPTTLKPLETHWS